jgi:hypothetical protein
LIFFADDVDEFPALRKSIKVSVDLHAISGPCHDSPDLRIRMRGSSAGRGKHHNMAETFIPTLEYRRAVAAFAAAMGIETDAVKTTLGEGFNVWPESIKRDRRR